MEKIGENVRMDGKLYIVATPIGNLEDITIRAINILKQVDTIIAEDTRHTLKLLNHLKISKPLISYYKQTEHTKTSMILTKIENGESIALVSDAGTPGISDPGEVIIKEAIKRNIEVVPIPGACAFVNALVASGLDCNHFYFEGFLPVNKKERYDRLEQVKYLKSTIVFYEAPHKLLATLEDIRKVIGDRKIVLARELTKIHEEFIRGTISNILENIPENIKGEFVVIVEGSEFDKKEIEIQNLNKLTIEEHYEYYKGKGLNKKESIKQVAKDRGVQKNDIYKEFLDE